MATYKEIKGVTLQTRDSDPVVNVGSWSSGGALNDCKITWIRWRQELKLLLFVNFGGQELTPVTGKTEDV